MARLLLFMKQAFHKANLLRKEIGTMKTETVKKVTVLLTAVLFVVGAASFALAASAKSTGDIACPLMDNKTLARLDLTQTQMAKIHSACEQHVQPGQQQSRVQSRGDDWWLEEQSRGKDLYRGY